MKSELFFKLKKDDEVYVPADADEKVYSVLSCDDRMGRVQIARKTYRVQSFEYDIDREFDNYDDAVELTEEYQNMWPNDIDEEVDTAHAFWMHYTEVEYNY